LLKNGEILDQKKKKIWEEKAYLDKRRYEVEKQFFTGPWKVPTLRRGKKDPTAPKRPMSSFLAYSMSKRSEVKQNNPNLHNTQLSKILSEMWKNAPEDEREKFKKWEEEKRMVYKDDINKWRKMKMETLEKERTEREKAAMLMATSDSSGYAGAQNFLNFHQEASVNATTNMNSSIIAFPPSASDIGPLK